ncbi:hypothetical protein ACIQNG_19680 [Streptomyces sp. NPDC091377]|uniref:hypothetical protein n=1 Tax=Streptomyces sp. NPDC091377 TaxID=3365995 RepID=UPI0037F652A7
MNPRLLALTGLAVCAVALPLAVASAGPVGDERRAAGTSRDDRRPPEARRGASMPGTSLLGASLPGAWMPGASMPVAGAVGGAVDGSGDTSGSGDGFRDTSGSGGGSGDTSGSATGAPLRLGLGLATAARCGPELTSPDGIEAQTCVLTQGEDTWARTYYRNATGEALTAVLSLMGPGGRTVTLHCEVGPADEPADCATPRERTRGNLDHYTAIAEFARAAGEGPLLLRSGSNSAVAARQ